MKTSGFTLLEVLIATAIAALLGYAIMLVLYQINRVQPTINRYTEPYFGALIMQQHLLHDCSGIEVPLTQWLAIAQKQKEHEKAKEKKAPQPPAPEKAGEKKEEGPEPEKEKGEKKIPLIKDLFVLTNGPDGMFSTLSFITTNPLQPFWGDKTGKYVPRAVRVVYRLQEDKRTKSKTKRYVLLRQESENFDLEKIAIPDQKSWHQYMLGAHIKSCKIELVYAVRIKKMTEEKPAAPAGTPAPQPPAKQESPASKVTYEIKTTKEWKDRNYDQPPDDKKKSQQDEPLLPYLIKMDLVMYDELSARSVPFTLTLPIFSERVYIEPLEGGGRLTDIIKKLADTMLPDQKQKKDGPLMAHAPVPHTINPPISLMPAPAELIPIAQKDSAHATHA